MNLNLNMSKIRLIACLSKLGIPVYLITLPKTWENFHLPPPPMTNQLSNLG